MKKYLYSIFLLLLFTGVAWADSSNPQIYSSAVANKTDLSIAYLSSVFGTVSGVLNGTSGQMLGKLLYQFNQGILILSGCWLGFTVLGVVFKALPHGSFMQQDGAKSVHMVALRVALGFGLLIPSPSTGYTLLQGIVMQVVVQGVKLADQIWEYGLDYMYSGGALWSRPVQNSSVGADIHKPSFMNEDDTTAVLGKSDANGTALSVSGSWSNLSMIQKIMAMEACMVQSSVDSDNSPSDSGVSSQQDFSINEDTEQFKFFFPGKGGHATCGALSWNQTATQTTLNCVKPTDKTNNTNYDSTDCEYNHMALREVIFDLLPSVKQYVCGNQGNGTTSATCTGFDSADYDANVPEGMTSGLLNFKNLIDPIVRKNAALNSSTSEVLKFVKQAKIDGWMTAGRYYWDLLRVEGAYDSAMNQRASYKVVIPGETAYTIPALNFDPDSPKTYNLLMNKTAVGSNTYIDKVNTNLGNFATASSAGRTATSVSPGAAGALKWLMMLFMPMLAGIGSIFLQFSTQAGPLGLGPEPILWLHNIGISCMQLGGDLWIGIAIALFPIAISTSFCSGFQPLAGSVKMVVEWIQPIILAAGAGFFVVGVSLGIYMPLYPYMVFTFGVIGWIIAVIEGMVAAPLVAMGVTHPDGHDFLGRASQSVMLLVSLFLRPSLMLIGLFAAMILCQVSLSMILYTFSGFATDIFYNVSPVSGPPTGDVLLQGVGAVMGHTFAGGTPYLSIMTLIIPLFVFPMFLGIFTMLVYLATTTCFSLPSHLIKYVGNWLGAPQVHDDVTSAADHMKQGLTAAASKLSDAAGHTKWTPPKKDKTGLQGDNAPAKPSPTSPAKTN